MNEYLEFGKKLAYEAGEMIVKGFDKQMQVELKPDESPVTETDRAINSMVIEAIQQKYPGHGVIGEEENLGDGTEEYQWICDPLDGTKPFVMKVPLSTFILGLIHNGTPLFSIVYHPFTNQLYHAVSGGGAFCNDEAIQVSRSELSSGYFLTGAGEGARMSKIKAAGAQLFGVPGRALKVCMIADGRATGMYDVSGDLHDIIVASLLVTEAGGLATTFEGEPLDFTKLKQSVVLSNGVVHEEVLKILADS